MWIFSFHSVSLFFFIFTLLLLAAVPLMALEFLFFWSKDGRIRPVISSNLSNSFFITKKKIFFFLTFSLGSWQLISPCQGEIEHFNLLTSLHQKIFTTCLWDFTSWEVPLQVHGFASSQDLLSFVMASCVGRRLCPLWSIYRRFHQSL